MEKDKILTYLNNNDIENKDVLISFLMSYSNKEIYSRTNLIGHITGSAFITNENKEYFMINIAKKAAELGVSIVTLRRWHQKGLLSPDFITLGGHRRYNKQQTKENRIIVGYRRVSSHDQKEDLQRQSSILKQSGVNKI